MKPLRNAAGRALLAITAVACASAEPGAPADPAGPADAWVLSWADEFDGPAGALVDATRWDFDLGGHGWGNQELQYYTARSANASLNGEGQLAIRALREDYQGPDGVTRGFTSARLKSQGRFEQAYGRFEARLKLPFGQGLWPAFWMLGADIPAVGWPECGEIDVMENIGREPSIVHGTLHGPGYSGAGGLSGSFSLPGGGRFADAFHVFAVEWEPAAIRWYVDGQLYQERTPAALAGRRWAFDHPFFVILNVAVGGSWPGSPDATTSFPQTLLVDYVRVYRRG
jgi:beta-glucanase (GH16 family)